MNEKNTKAAESRKKYDAENMAILATKMKKDEARLYIGTLFGHQVPWGVDVYK